MILLLLGNLYGFQWPVSDVVLISTFGESEFDEYIKGLDIGGDVQDIRPIDSGELVYYSHYNSSPLDLPSGLGSFVIYQHKNGIRSLYGHLEDSSIKTDNYKVGMSDVIGTMGSTGTTVGSMLHLQVLDTEFKKYINPLLSLPFLDDKTNPVINEVILSSSQGRFMLGSEKKIQSGIYSLSADIRDLSESAGYYCPLAPYSISLFINGENLANINFESLRVEDGEMFLQESDGIPY
ncbi:MAG: M23 family metallopeptidase, partial [Spirochaetota bacterium]|nr:M23 family metallopeptidase [Spirochaetota bacterium]